MTSSSNSSQSTRPTGQELWGELLVFLDFTCNYEQTSGIYVPMELHFIMSHELFAGVSIICLISAGTHL